MRKDAIPWNDITAEQRATVELLIGALLTTPEPDAVRIEKTPEGDVGWPANWDGCLHVVWGVDAEGSEPCTGLMIDKKGCGSVYRRMPIAKGDAGWWCSAHRADLNPRDEVTVSTAVIFLAAVGRYPDMRPKEALS